MGLALGSIISNIYMSNLENMVFNTINKSNIYLRYVNDIPSHYLHLWNQHNTRDCSE